MKINEDKIKITFYFDPKVDIELDKKDAFLFLDSMLGRSSMEFYQEKHSGMDSPFKVPNRSRIEEFIKSQPDYKFSFEDMAQHFLGDDWNKIDNSELTRWLNAIRSKANRIRQTIANSENGDWINDYDGRYKVFKFVLKSENSQNESITSTYNERNTQEVFRNEE